MDGSNDSDTDGSMAEPMSTDFYFVRIVESEIRGRPALTFGIWQDDPLDPDYFPGTDEETSEDDY